MEFRASVTLVNKPGTLKGFASVNIDEQFAVKGIRIVEGENGPFLSMPSRKVGENYEDMCFPVTKECRDKLNETVLKAYEQKLSQKEEQTNEEKQENENKGSKKQSSSKSQKESSDSKQESKKEELSENEQPEQIEEGPAMGM